jgi:hypothetical protein
MLSNNVSREIHGCVLVCLVSPRPLKDYVPFNEYFIANTTGFNNSCRTYPIDHGFLAIDSLGFVLQFSFDRVRESVANIRLGDPAVSRLLSRRIRLIQSTRIDVISRFYIVYTGAISHMTHFVDGLRQANCCLWSGEVSQQFPLVPGV